MLLYEKVLAIEYNHTRLPLSVTIFKFILIQYIITIKDFTKYYRRNLILPANMIQKDLM